MWDFYSVALMNDSRRHTKSGGADHNGSNSHDINKP